SRNARQTFAIRAEGHLPASFFEGKKFLAGLRIPDLHPSTSKSARAGQTLAVGAVGQAADWGGGLEGEDLRVAEPVEIIPFESAQIAFPRFGAMLLQQLPHPLGTARLPGVVGQVHVGRIQRALKPIIQGADFITLPLGLVTLLLSLIALLLR